MSILDTLNGFSPGTYSSAQSNSSFAPSSSGGWGSVSGGDWAKLGTGLLGALFGDDGDNGQAQSYQAAIESWSKLAPVPVADTAIKLQRAVILGQITPAQAMAQLAEASAMAGVTVPPQLQKAQFDALNQMQNIAAQGGLTAVDRAQLADIATKTATEERGQREALLQNAAQRGVAGSGLEMAAQLQTQQSSADRAARSGLDVAALAQKRALEAISQSGQMAGSMRTQDVAEQAAKAQAADAVSKFNAQMRQQAEQSNVEARNKALQYNLDKAYDVQTQNLAAQKAEQLNKAAQANTRFDQATTIAKGKSGAFNQQAAGQQQQSSGGGDDGFGSIVSAAIPVIGSLFSDERTKENIQPLTNEQVTQMLNDLTGYSYTYKGETPGVGGTPSVGVMAQDMEKGPMAQDVVNTPNGKMIADSPHKQSLMLAALANINKRLNEGGL